MLARCAARRASDRGSTYQDIIDYTHYFKVADQSFASKVAPLIVKREYQPNELVYDCGDKVIVVFV